jgi:hypothetical protein
MGGGPLSLLSSQIPLSVPSELFGSQQSVHHCSLNSSPTGRPSLHPSPPPAPECGELKILEKSEREKAEKRALSYLRFNGRKSEDLRSARYSGDFSI